MATGGLTVLIGGARSGKSALSLRLGRRHAGGVTFLATSPRIEGDDDLDSRIAAHRDERPTGWTTVETELELAEAIGAAGDDLVIVDCITLWVNNLLHHGGDESSVLSTSAAALDAIEQRGGPTIAITNEVGLGIVPVNELARAYRDVLGRVNQQWVDRATTSLFLVAGRAIPLRSPEELL